LIELHRKIVCFLAKGNSKQFKTRSVLERKKKAWQPLKKRTNQQKQLPVEKHHFQKNI